MDEDGKTVGVGDAKAQTRAVLNAIKSVVETAGGTMADITFNSIFLKDLADYAAMNEIYREYFPSRAAGALLHSCRSGAAGIPG